MKKSVWTLAILFTLTGCLGKNPGAITEKSLVVSGNLSGVDAFRTTVYPIVSQKCSSCHGATQNPLFAVSDVNSAYTQAKSKANFSSIPSSPLVNRASNSGHCPSCGATTGSDMQNQIQAWWTNGECAAQGVCQSNGGGGTTVGAPPPGNRVTTNAIPIPANLTATFVVMSWDISPIDPVGLAGDRFTIEVQLDTSGGYSFRRPVITMPATATNSVYVRDVLVLINGNVANSTYTLVEAAVVAPGATLSVGVSPAIRTGPNDQISVSFGELRATAVRPCGALASWQTNVRPGMVANCVTCHTNNTTARTKFNMQNATDDQLCLRSKMHINKSNAFGSILIQNPLNALQGHPNVPNVTGVPAFFNPAWVNWINAEPN